jgi:hypothetical protein
MLTIIDLNRNEELSSSGMSKVAGGQVNWGYLMQNPPHSVADVVAATDDSKEGDLVGECAAIFAYGVYVGALI